MTTSELLAASPIACILVAPSGQAIGENAAWARLVGASRMHWLDSVHPDDRAVADALSRTGGQHREIRLAREGGWTRAVASSHACEEGHTLWFQPTEAEREDALESLQRERELNELKNRFISVVSHEFRTPLTVILSSSELLEHYGTNWPPERRSQHFRKIHTAVSVMTSLLDNVGLYGRAESGSLEVRPVAFAPCGLVAEIVAEARLPLPPGQEIVVAGEPDKRQVVSDPKLVRHAIANLLSNAIRYSQGATPIEIGCSWTRDSWKLEILDRGIGIPAQDAERVWERFQRGSNTDGIPGTGLGLPIVKRCAELLGGQATLSERSGGGCVARLEIPAHQTDSAMVSSIPG